MSDQQTSAAAAQQTNAVPRSALALLNGSSSTSGAVAGAPPKAGIPGTSAGAAYSVASRMAVPVERVPDSQNELSGVRGGDVSVPSAETPALLTRAAPKNEVLSPLSGAEKAAKAKKAAAAASVAAAQDELDALTLQRKQKADREKLALQHALAMACLEAEQERDAEQRASAAAARLREESKLSSDAAAGQLTKEHKEVDAAKRKTEDAFDRCTNAQTALEQLRGKIEAQEKVMARLAALTARSAVAHTPEQADDAAAVAAKAQTRLLNMQAAAAEATSEVKRLEAEAQQTRAEYEKLARDADDMAAATVMSVDALQEVAASAVAAHAAMQRCDEEKAELWLKVSLDKMKAAVPQLLQTHLDMGEEVAKARVEADAAKAEASSAADRANTTMDALVKAQAALAMLEKVNARAAIIAAGRATAALPPLLLAAAEEKAQKCLSERRAAVAAAQATDFAVKSEAARLEVKLDEAQQNLVWWEKMESCAGKIAALVEWTIGAQEAVEAVKAAQEAAQATQEAAAAANAKLFAVTAKW